MTIPGMTLAQAAPTAVFTNIFWLTIGFIFLAAIVGAVVARWRKDRCLKLLANYETTMQVANGRTVWGRLRVYSHGLEIHYDAPHQTPLGLLKNSYLLYDSDVNKLLSVARYVGQLSDAQRRVRLAQVEQRTNPSFARRCLRGIFNVFNTIRDAFTQTLSAFVGHIARSNVSQVVQTQQGQVDTIGRTLLGAVGNAYEPMLERHIGRPVIMELTHPLDPARLIELPGYLAEYSDRFIALFNVEHARREAFSLEVTQSVARDDLKVDVGDFKLAITNLHDVTLVVDAVTWRADDGGEQRRELGVVLTTGSSARIRRPADRCTLHLSRVQHIDIVAPRAHAAIRHASSHEPHTDTYQHLAPDHEDQQAVFP